MHCMADGGGARRRGRGDERRSWLLRTRSRWHFDVRVFRSSPLPSLPPTAKVVVVGSQIRPQDRERKGVIFKAAVPPPPQEQGEEFGIWFASDRGIFENLPSGGGCNKENGWLDRRRRRGETYCAAVLRRRSERGTRSFEPCSNNPLSICKVSQEPLSTTYRVYVSRRGAWPNIRTPASAAEFNAQGGAMLTTFFAPTHHAPPPSDFFLVPSSL